MPSQMVNPMLQQPMHPFQFAGAPPVVANSQSTGWAFPGYIYHNEYHTGEHTGLIPNEETKSEHCIEKEGCVGHNTPSNKASDTESTPTRANNDEYVDAEVEDVDHPEVQERNHNAATPHRGILGGNGEHSSRRVSFSPMIPLVNTPATTGDGKM